MLVSTGSTSSQSMKRSGVGSRRLRARIRYAPSIPSRLQQAGRADVDDDQVELAVDVVEAEVVDADHLAAIDVDDLLVEQVGAEEDLVRTLLEARDVDGPAGEAGARGVEPGDLRPGQEDAASVGRDDQAGHRRIAVADGDDQVVHLAERLAVGIEHGSADGLAQVEHDCHLTSGTSRRERRDREGSRSTVNERDGPGSWC